MGRGNTETELVFDNYSVKFCGFSVSFWNETADWSLYNQGLASLMLMSPIQDRSDVFLVLHLDFTISLSNNTPIQQTSGAGKVNRHLS